MLIPRLFAIVHMVLITHVTPNPAKQAPAAQKPPVEEQPAPKPKATPAEEAVKIPDKVEKDSTEKSLTGTDEAILWITTKKSRVKVETHRGVSFDIDFPTHGALSLAHICAELNTEPKGLTLSFSPKDGLLSADYDKKSQELLILLRGSKTPLVKFPLKLSGATTRVLLRQRAQLALFAVPPDGSQATLVWLGRVGYTLVFRNAAQYELCRDLKITMGKRDIPLEEFRKGVQLEALDEVADITVKGTSPKGEAFRHRYTFDYKTMVKLADSAYGAFMKAAGNTTADDEAEQAKPKDSDFPE